MCRPRSARCGRSRRPLPTAPSCRRGRSPRCRRRPCDRRTRRGAAATADPRSSVHRPRRDEEPPVRTERDVADRARVRELGDESARGRLPDAGHAIRIAGRDKRPARADIGIQGRDGPVAARGPCPRRDERRQRRRVERLFDARQQNREHPEVAVLGRAIERQAELLQLPVTEPTRTDEDRAGPRRLDPGGDLGLPVAAGRQAPRDEPRLDPRLPQPARDPLHGRLDARGRDRLPIERCVTLGKAGGRTAARLCTQMP